MTTHIRADFTIGGAASRKHNTEVRPRGRTPVYMAHSHALGLFQVGDSL
jgi:hypothetical protein